MAIIIIFLIVIKLRQIKKKGSQPIVHPEKASASSFVEDFSGDDRYDTELDLAQAYLELHQLEKAKHLLKSVITHGKPHQILEARKMFTLLLKQERHS